MWRHGLLLRCKPSYLIVKDPAICLISKTSYLNPKIYVKNIFTNSQSWFPIRSYSKAVGLSEVLPDISLEVKPTDSVENNPIKVGKSNTTFVFVEGAGTVSENKPRPSDKVLVGVIENNATDSEELCLNGVGLKSILKATDSEGVLRHRVTSPGCETDSDKANQTDGQVVLNDNIANKNNENNLKESLNDESAAKPRPNKDVTDIDLGLGLIGLTENTKRGISDQPTPTPTPKDSWFSTIDDEIPVRIYGYDQHQMIFEAIDKTNELTSEQWDELHKRVLSTGDNIVNEDNIQGSIMEKCLVHKLLGTGLSYLNYLSASAQYEPNIATIGTFCKLASFFPSEVDRNDNNVQNIITSSYDKLRAKYPIFDAVTADHIICGLSLTKRWKEGLQILEEIRLTSVPPKRAYSALVRASFDNDEPDMGWELVSKMLQEGRKPTGFVYDSWLEYCRRSAAGNKAVEQRLVEKLLHFLASNDIRLKEPEAIKLRLWFEYDAPPEADWIVEFTTVDSRGICQSCHQRLTPSRVSPEDFESLRSVFMAKTLVGSNIFLKSTPEELEQYQNFIKETAPYDVVIDGLNVGYSARSVNGKPNYAGTLQSVVEHFVSRSEKVLVLGRKHMENWSGRHMDFVYKNAEVFLAENLSQDDPFLLYAAMYSGLNTRFISKDLMRGHAFLLKDPKLQSIFLRWQKQYQLQISYIGHDGYIKFRLPARYNTSVQCNRNGEWHVPYDKETDSTRHQSVTVPMQWLCLTHFKEQYYNDRFEDDSDSLANNRYKKRENGVYNSSNSYRQAPFGKSKPLEDSLDSSDEDNGPSQFGKRNYVNRGLDRKESTFGRTRASAERYGDSDDDEDKPSQYVTRRPAQVYSDDEPSVSSQLRKERHVGQRFGDGRPKFRSTSKWADDNESGDEEMLKSVPKQSLSEVRFKDELLESESKRAFKSNQTRAKPVRRDDD